MDALAVLRSKIPDFPGYADQEERRLSDELVRSYLGEALAGLQTRIGSQAPPRLEDLLVRAGFMNQAAFHAFEYAHLDATHIEAISSNDARIVELADDAVNVTVATLDHYMADVGAAFDARDQAMKTAAA
jgi:hypothetical protein